MKTLLTSFLFTVSLFVASANESFSQADKKALEKQVTIPTEAIRIDSLLKHLSKQTGVEFSFNSRKISPSKKLSAGSNKKTVSQWLALLNESFGIQHKFVGNHIILIDKSNVKPVTNKVGPRSETGSNKTTTSRPAALHKDKPGIRQGNDMPLENIENRSQVAAKIDTAKSITIVPLVKENMTSPDTTKNEKQIPFLQEATKKGGDKQEQEANSISGNANKEETFQILLGFSKHGSGDMNGILFGAEYWESISTKFSTGFMLRATINSEKHTILFSNTGSVDVASVRFTTAGVQLGATGSYSFIKSKMHDFGAGLGIFGRYQSASNGDDGYGIIYPTTTNYAAILIELYNRTPQHTYSFGGLFQLQYKYHFSDRIYTGVIAGFQTDTNGDVILQAGLVFGRSFGRD